MGPADTAVLFLSLINGAQLGRIAVASTKRSANDSFFNSSFNPCKGLRSDNPVEAVRSHVFATKIFNGVALKRWVGLATKYTIPAFALYPLGTKSCYLAIVVYATLSETGNLVLEANIRQDVVYAAFKRFLAAAETGSLNMIVRHRGQKYRVPWVAVHDWFDLIANTVTN